MWIGPAKPRLLKFYRPPIRSTRFWLKSLGAARSHPIMYGSLTRSTARPILFTASRGRGAFLNNRRLRVSSRAKLAEALLGVGFCDPKNLNGYLALYSRI